MFVSGLGSWQVGLVTPALNLSFGSWAFGPASFLKINYASFWAWKLKRRTCHFSIGLIFLEASPNKLCLFLDLEAGALDLSFQRWTFLLEAGPAAQLHS